MRTQKGKNAELKWVYGTRTGKWYLVDGTDRDYHTAISQDEMNEIGFEAAKEKYLSPSIVRGENPPSTIKQ